MLFYIVGVGGWNINKCYRDNLLTFLKMNSNRVNTYNVFILHSILILGLNFNVIKIPDNHK